MLLSGNLKEEWNMDGRFPKKQETSEKLKAKQYGAAALTCILVAVIMTVIRLIWGSVILGSDGDKIPLGMIIFYVRYPVLLFGAINFVSAIYHFMLWNRNGRPIWKVTTTACFLTGKAGNGLRLKFRWF